MGANELNELWNLLRENEKSIAVLSERFGQHDETLKKLSQDNEAMRAILNRAIGAKTVVGVIGGAVCIVIGWTISYLTRGA